MDEQSPVSTAPRTPTELDRIRGLIKGANTFEELEGVIKYLKASPPQINDSQKLVVNSLIEIQYQVVRVSDAHKAVDEEQFKKVLDIPPQKVEIQYGYTPETNTQSAVEDLPFGQDSVKKVSLGEMKPHQAVSVAEEVFPQKEPEPIDDNEVPTAGSDVVPTAGTDIVPTAGSDATGVTTKKLRKPRTSNTEMDVVHNVSDTIVNKPSPIKSTVTLSREIQKPIEGVEYSKNGITFSVTAPGIEQAMADMKEIETVYLEQLKLYTPEMMKEYGKKKFAEGKVEGVEEGKKQVPVQKTQAPVQQVQPPAPADNKDTLRYQRLNKFLLELFKQSPATRGIYDEWTKSNPKI